MLLVFYEAKVAPLLAIHMHWVYFPIYLLCKRYNICFVVNIAGGVGHIVAELDCFARRLYVQEIDTRKRYVWIRKGDRFSKPCVKLYGRYFWFAKASYLLYEFILPITIRFKDITLDAGFSGLLWQLDHQGKYIRPLPGQDYLNLLQLRDMIHLWIKYYKIRYKTAHYYPLLAQVKSSHRLKKFLGNDGQEFVLIHVKETLGNATAAPTDAHTYLELISILQKRGYKVIFVGREKIPSCFLDCGVLNYAEYKYASFLNDILLFQNCKMAIVGGSGISFLADCYQVPYLYVNSWHLASPTYSPLSINVPTLLQKQCGAFLTFKEQIDLYLEIEPDGKIPRLKEYMPRNASSDELVAALRELDFLVQEETPWTDLQQSVRGFRNDIHLAYTGSRFSEFFLRKHQNSLGIG